MGNFFTKILESVKLKRSSPGKIELKTKLTLHQSDFDDIFVSPMRPTASTMGLLIEKRKDKSEEMKEVVLILRQFENTQTLSDPNIMKLVNFAKSK